MRILEDGDPEVDRLFAELDALRGAGGEAAQRRAAVIRRLAVLLVPEPTAGREAARQDQPLPPRGDGLPAGREARPDPARAASRAQT